MIEFVAGNKLPSASQYQEGQCIRMRTTMHDFVTRSRTYDMVYARRLGGWVLTQAKVVRDDDEANRSQ